MCAAGRNPGGVVGHIGNAPKVARSEQPWALMRNPFEVEISLAYFSQGSSVLPDWHLSQPFVSESLWDSQPFRVGSPAPLALGPVWIAKVPQGPLKFRNVLHQFLAPRQYDERHLWD